MLSGTLLCLVYGLYQCYLFSVVQNLNRLAELVRGSLPKLVRNIIGALITLDVHARDTVTAMVTNGVWTTSQVVVVVVSFYR